MFQCTPNINIILQGKTGLISITRYNNWGAHKKTYRNRPLRFILSPHSCIFLYVFFYLYRNIYVIIESPEMVDSERNRKIFLRANTWRN